MTYYKINEAKNGVEIYFDKKPAEAVREELKANGFRWGRGYWWAKQTAERLALAKKYADEAGNPLDEYTTEATPGYMGAIETTGSEYANGRRLYGAELAKAIREAFKRCGISGCTVSAKTFSGGQEIIVKAKATPADYVSREDFAKGFDLLHSGYWFTDEEGHSIHRDALPFDDMERFNKLQAINAEKKYNCLVNNMADYGVQVHNVPEGFFTAKFQLKLDAIQKVLDAFNHDDSNGMVDYFDRHFYDFIRVKAA